MGQEHSPFYLGGAGHLGYRRRDHAVECLVESEIESLHAEQSRRTDPTAIARANSVVQGLMDAIEEYEEKAAKAEASGNTAKALVAREAAAARKIWLAEAQKGLSDFNK